MRIYQQFLLILILCSGCASAPSLLGFREEKLPTKEYNPLIPKENIIIVRLGRMEQKGEERIYIEEAFKMINV